MITVAAQVTLALAVNAASDQDRWPGVLDLVRTHPWWAALCLLVVVALLAVLTVFVQDWRAGLADGVQKTIHVSGGQNSVIQQADGNHKIAHRDYREYHYHGPTISTTGPSERHRGPTVLYTAVPPLHPSWDNLLYGVVDEVESDQRSGISCHPAYGRADQFEFVDAYVIMFDATDGCDVLPDVRVAARQCRESSPSAKILIVGCGNEETSTSERELCDTVRTWSLTGQWQASVFMSPKTLRAWLAGHLSVAVSVARRRSSSGYDSRGQR
ncbi:MAG: hypothetical protein SYR96_25780 [Actinomycetota bacterium]|nr:hypothetical protein [Actinomycetota bacterium]